MSGAAPLTVIVLAAGEGTRMRSRSHPKVLHGFAGRTLLGHVLAAAAPLRAARTLVVVGHRRAEVVAHLRETHPDTTAVVQAEQRGTGDAVGVALAAVPQMSDGVVVVVPGDAPLLTDHTLRALVDEHRRSGAAVTLLTSAVGDPTGYGRVVRDAAGRVLRVVEHRDADSDELAITEIATSVYAFDEAALREAIPRLSTDNAQGELYLPDVVALAAAKGRVVAAVVAPADETAGVNDRVQLAAAHHVYNRRLLETHMRAGVSVIDPATTWVDAEVVLEADVTLWPDTDLHGTTHVGEGAHIGPQTTLADTRVGPDARVSRAVAHGSELGAGVTVGPFAYLRPGTVLAADVHVGTYVELKNATVGEGSKIPHLSYVGDADIGAHSNIGAATVFVNYDGVAKHRSRVGNHARTGADNMFVAPVEIGDGAYTAAGSVITEDVPPGAMGVGRARQRNVEGWVSRKRPGTPAAEAAERADRSEDPRGEEH